MRSVVRVYPDPPFDDHGAIAQLGEHLLCKQGVVGSIPTGSTRFGIRRSQALKVITEYLAGYSVLVFGSDEVFNFGFCSLTIRNVIERCRINLIYLTTRVHHVKGVHEKGYVASNVSITYNVKTIWGYMVK